MTNDKTQNSAAVLPSSLPAVQAKTVGLHPLLYRKRIERVDRQVQPGDLVEVFDSDRELAGYGLYNPKSELALRMLSGRRTAGRGVLAAKTAASRAPSPRDAAARRRDRRLPRDSRRGRRPVGPGGR